jgi:hypothetical protein
MVPQFRAHLASGKGRVFTLDPGHVGIETFDVQLADLLRGSLS